MEKTPKSLRITIGIFGRTNVGKSSFLNSVVGQDVSIVSKIAGTTTDPVEKPMELLPLGPVLFIDTAGIDDSGGLIGELRTQKTKKIFDRVDVGVVITEANVWGDFEKQIIHDLTVRRVPTLIVLNKIDIITDSIENELRCHKNVISLSTKHKDVTYKFKQALLDIFPEEFINDKAIVRDLVEKNDLVFFIIPIDKEAPKGRLILPEVQAIRDILDGEAMCIISRETSISSVFDQLKYPPKLVVTDSSCFDVAANSVPDKIPLTSFSILFSRFKGDLMSQAIDTLKIDALLPNDKILISEACSHHPIADDIGRKKIPRLLENYLGMKLNFEFVQGFDFPEDLCTYNLVISCGACMFNRRVMLNRVFQCKNANVPFTNYGLVIAHCLKILPRALKPFPDVFDAYMAGRK